MFRRLTFGAFATLALLAPPRTTSAQTVITHFWNGTELVAPTRVSRNMVGSHYLSPPKTFPGTEFGSEYSFVTFDFINPFNTAAGFLVSNVGSTQDGAHVVAYLGAFNMFEVATGYLGDSGYSCHAFYCPSRTDFSVLVPANATVQVATFRPNGGTAPGGGFAFTADWAQVTTVVPEPSTYALVATGLVALLAVQRRRRVE
ncbi:MAG: PEP-CTERM sorting domain-containing protein [Gemmatimonadaceae bacterium]|jgi:hypothetical protein|nr:PEP-CTERM sorting domain-containing protein [Gemmatimonadaceae bacterium]